VFDHLLDWLLFTLVGSLLPIGVDALIYAARNHSHWGGATLVDRGQMLLCGLGLAFTTMAILLADALGVRVRKLLGVAWLLAFLSMVVLYAAVENSRPGEIGRGFIVWMSIGLYCGAAVLAAVSTAAAAWRDAVRP
jgi:hypothetical protein